ncbi:MAG: hypothetical protein ACTSYZ_04415 [Candidatus Helarchaeota archaeon]
MYQINASFFLIGALIFYVIKFTSELKLGDEKSLEIQPKRNVGTVFYLWVGSIFLFAAANLIQTMMQIAIYSLAPMHGIIYIIPTIILLIHSIIFIIPSFIRPTVNFLLGIAIGTGLIIGILLVMSYLFPYSFIDFGLGVLPFPMVIASPTGVFCALGIYLLLKKYLTKYNVDLWDISAANYIKFFKNQWFGICFMIITFITAWIYISL